MCKNKSRAPGFRRPSKKYHFARYCHQKLQKSSISRDTVVKNDQKEAFRAILSSKAASSDTIIYTLCLHTCLGSLLELAGTLPSTCEHFWSDLEHFGSTLSMHLLVARMFCHQSEHLMLSFCFFPGPRSKSCSSVQASAVPFSLPDLWT